MNDQWIIEEIADAGYVSRIRDTGFRKYLLVTTWEGNRAFRFPPVEDTITTSEEFVENILGRIRETEDEDLEAAEIAELSDEEVERNPILKADKELRKIRESRKRREKSAKGAGRAVRRRKNARFS